MSSSYPDPPEHLAEAWKQYQRGGHVDGADLRALDEWRADCHEDSWYEGTYPSLYDAPLLDKPLKADRARRAIIVEREIGELDPATAVALAKALLSAAVQLDEVKGWRVD